MLAHLKIESKFPQTHLVLPGFMERQIFYPSAVRTLVAISHVTVTKCDIFGFLGKRLAPVKSTRLPTNRTDNAPPTGTNNTLVRE